MKAEEGVSEAADTEAGVQKRGMRMGKAAGAMGTETYESEEIAVRGKKNMTDMSCETQAKNPCPLVSITTVTHNSEKTLTRTLESVLNQTYDTIEYLIIDGLSSDSTVQIAESYREKFAARGYGYRILSEQDSGMYDAINKGIRLSHGEIIGNINSDDWYEPEAVEKAVRFMEESGCDYMYADLRMVKPDNTSFLKQAKLQKLATSRGWNHPTQFARRALHLKYPYKLESLHDDFDFFLKVRKSDFRIAVLNETLANFTMEGISHERNLKAAFARGRCRYRIYQNNGYSRWYLLECIMIEAAKFLLHLV